MESSSHPSTDRGKGPTCANLALKHATAMLGGMALSYALSPAA
jgi:hypothetical protein